MKKFEVGNWVFDEATKRYGRVVSHVEDTRSVKVRWLHEKRVDSGVYSAASLSGLVPAPFVLEGVLNDNIYEGLNEGQTIRSERAVLQTLFGQYSEEWSIRSIYQLSDINLLVDDIEDRHPPFVHLICHGDVEEKTKRPFIQLYKDAIYLDDSETIEVFKNFAGYPLFMSACNIGRYEKPIQEFREATGVGPVIASTREISDNEAILFGLMLYHAVYGGGLEIDGAYHAAINSLELLGVSGRPGRAQRYARLFE